MNIKWTIPEENYIKENSGVLTDKQIAEYLNNNSTRKITLYAVRRKRQKLGLKKKQGRGYCQLTTDFFLDESLDAHL